MYLFDPLKFYKTNTQRRASFSPYEEYKGLDLNSGAKRGKVLTKG